MSPVVQLESVTKEYGSGASGARAVADVSLSVAEGEFVSVMGPRGCGKSTLLNLIAGLEVPTSGRVLVCGEDLSRLSDKALSDLRLRYLGFIFQSFNLLPRLTVEQNVSWRLGLIGVSGRPARDRTAAVLERMGVPPSTWARYPSELSGGEQQRVAAARALATEPKLLLADEPTGNLDSASGRTMLDLLRSLNLQRRMSVVMATHDSFAGTYGHRTIRLKDGRIVREAGEMERSPAAEGQVLPFRRRGE
ncbi:MAG: ABC transporter ATP-binding protein [Deltaproteobacteria bacterium]|nr:ABC transporter ATP-binding protein [Deltaproteobacteria bacterium]